MGLFDRFSRKKTTDSYAEHMQPYARRARSRQIDVRPGYAPKLSLPELAEYYRTNRLVRKIVDIPANGAANEAPQFSGNDRQKRFYTDIFSNRELNLMPAHRRGLKWGGLYGLGVGLIDIDDRLPLDKPLTPRRASKLNGITVLSRRSVWPVDFSAGIQSEYFQVWGNMTNLGQVHRSRLLIYDGEDLDEVSRLNNSGCGESRINQMSQALSRLFGGLESFAFALQVFSTFLYRVENLDNMIANDGQKVERKLNAMDEFRHLTRMLTIDKKDEIEYKTMNLTGLPDCINVLKEMVAIETGLPQMILFGSSPTGSGLANGGMSESAQFESFIRQLRTDSLDGNLEYQLWVISTIYGVPMPGWKLKPALPPDQEREIKMRETQARIDAGYVAMGAYGVSTVRANRFEGDYSFETDIHEDDLMPVDEIPIAEPVIEPDEDDQEDDPNAENTQEPLPANSGE